MARVLRRVVVPLVLLGLVQIPSTAGEAREKARERVSTRIAIRNGSVGTIGDALVEYGRPILAIEHMGSRQGGFFSASGAQARAAVTSFVHGLRTLGVKRPRIAAVEVEGAVSRSSLEALGIDVLSVTRVKRSPESTRTDSLGGQRSQSVANEAGAARLSSVAATSWAPERGSVDMFETGDSLFPRGIRHNVTWDTGTDISSFGDRAYEHDFKLYNPEVSDLPEYGDDPETWGRPLPCPLPAQADDFWADRGSGVYLADFPPETKPYFDTEWGDSCKVMDFTVGLYWPKFLQTDTTYTIELLQSAGDTESSAVELHGQVAPKECNDPWTGVGCEEPCDHTPYCVGIGESELEEQVAYLPPFEYSAPGCIEWAGLSERGVL